jgi:uncharacterized protein
MSDPRPVVVADGDGHLLAGARCSACGHALARVLPRCPRCGAAVSEARFGPEGEVWALTVLHVAPAGRDAPYTLAYVDLDDGPRLLAHVSGATAIGSRVRLIGSTSDGDPAVEAIA